MQVAAAQRQSSSQERTLEAIVLAAGRGTRMEGDLAKVLHTVADRPMIDWVVDACESAGCERVAVVVGYQADRVTQALAARTTCCFVEQREQLGTGHAVLQAAPIYRDAARAARTDVLVLAGDGPLIRPGTIDRMVRRHRRTGATATIATSVIEDPTGYGRVVRDGDGAFRAIVEHRDAGPAERAIREVYPSYCCFRADALFAALPEVGNDNAKGEYYLTDLFGLLRRRGHRIEAVDAVPPEDVLSINTPEQLEQVDRVLRQRLSAETAG